MSYDVSLMINTGKEHHEIVEVGNLTYNVYPMLVKSGIGRLGDLDGKKAESVISILRNGIRAIENDIPEYEKLNPINGWGSCEDTLLFLKNMLELCERHYKCYVRVC